MVPLILAREFARVLIMEDYLYGQFRLGPDLRAAFPVAALIDSRDWEALDQVELITLIKLRERQTDAG